MSSTLRIFYLSDATIPSRLANSVHVMKMSRALSDIGVEIVLYANKGKSQGKDPFKFYGVTKNFKIKFVPSAIFFKSTFWTAIYSILSVSIDKKSLIYTRSIYALLLAMVFRIPAAIEMHSKIENHKNIKLMIFRFALRHHLFKGFVVISEPLREYYQKLFNLKSTKILLAPDAADIISSSVIPQKLRNEKRLCVGYVGQLFKGRGIELIYELSKRLPNIDFHIVGGLEPDINYWEEITKHQNNLTFHGFVAASETSKFLKAFDVVLAPYQRRVTILGRGDSSEWMSPLKLFEYMGAGVPIVASDLPSIRSILHHGKTGILCSPDNIESWFYAISQLESDPNFRIEIGANALDELSKKYTWNLRAEKIFSWLSVS